MWPLETQGATAFAEGKREILVVEEKRAIIEPQLNGAVQRAGRPPSRVVGKTDERGEKLLKSDGERRPRKSSRRWSAALAWMPSANAPDSASMP